MAKNLALVALLLCVAALFLPLRSLIGITEGAFGGTIKNVALGLMLTVPSMFPALFGATLGRSGFRRGLGVFHFLFGLIALGLCGMAATEPAGIQLELGGYLAITGAVLVFVAGLIGLVKPDPK